MPVFTQAFFRLFAPVVEGVRYEQQRLQGGVIPLTFGLPMETLISPLRGGFFRMLL